MSVPPLKRELIDALWRATDRNDDVTSATLTGSFANSDSLDGLSDIDFVVILKKLDEARFHQLISDYDRELKPVLAKHGYDLMINPTLGPLKFNSPNLAVLHLMLYTESSHLSHVLQSPFTCLDWQRSDVYRKKNMAEVYPTFGLQPQHFISARRSISDYLSDFRSSSISYREYSFVENGYIEVKKSKPMTLRDRHEFSYHVMRFLMINLLKLVRFPVEESQQLDGILAGYGKVFPERAGEICNTLRDLSRKKRTLDFDQALPNLDERLESFVAVFEKQFRTAFITNATRHILFRHAPTELNVGDLRFQGRTDSNILPNALNAGSVHRLQDALRENAIQKTFVSPLSRSLQSLQLVVDGAKIPVQIDSRIAEINYGHCEGLTVCEATSRFPALFSDWAAGKDPRFPDGENTEDVWRRAREFVESQLAFEPSSAVCSHNVVLRTIVGSSLGIPASQWHRLLIPHLAPITVLMTDRFGWFVELDQSVQEEMFSNFATSTVAISSDVDVAAA
jgi:broad specificity phosphatase PhoE